MKDNIVDINKYKKIQTKHKKGKNKRSNDSKQGFKEIVSILNKEFITMNK